MNKSVSNNYHTKTYYISYRNHHGVKGQGVLGVGFPLMGKYRFWHLGN